MDVSNVQLSLSHFCLWVQGSIYSSFFFSWVHAGQENLDSTEIRAQIIRNEKKREREKRKFITDDFHSFLFLFQPYSNMSVALSATIQQNSHSKLSFYWCSLFFMDDYWFRYEQSHESISTKFNSCWMSSIGRIE